MSMTGNFLILAIGLALLIFVGCGTNYDNGVPPLFDSEEVALEVQFIFPNRVEIFGKIENQNGFINSGGLPSELAFNQGHFRAEIDGTRYAVQADPKIPGKYHLKTVVKRKDQYRISLTNFNDAAILIAYAAPETPEIEANTQTTARAILYEARKNSSGSEFSFKSFVPLITPEQLQTVRVLVQNAVFDDHFLLGEQAIGETDTVRTTTDSIQQAIPLPGEVVGGEADSGSAGETTGGSGSSTTGDGSPTTANETGPASVTSKPSAVLAINGGATYTNSTQVTLNLTVSAGVGVLQMSVDGGNTWETLNQARPYTISGPDGEVNISVYLKDSNGNVSDKIEDTIILDTTSPAGVISNVLATCTSSIDCQISWNTASESLQSIINYGLSPGAMTQSVSDSTLAFSHNLTLTSLSASTTYYYQLISKDLAGNSLASGPYSFQTPYIGEVWNLAVASAPFSKRDGHGTLVFNQKLWVFGGQQYDLALLNDVWYTDDCINWTCATTSAQFPGRTHFGYTVFQNKMWVIGGTDGSDRKDVWSSSDGITWTQATANGAFGNREGHGVVTFDTGTGEKMWLIAGYSGGYKNDIWSSSDGVSWIQETANGGFSTRAGVMAVSFNNKMWFTGSWSANNILSSVNGIAWTDAFNGFDPNNRWYPGLAVYQNKIWRSAGRATGGIYYNDVWFSQDGTNWKKVNPTQVFSERHQHSFIEFKGKLWIIAGRGYPGNTYNNDVWWSQ